jgi:hypothetical protein
VTAAGIACAALLLAACSADPTEVPPPVSVTPSVEASRTAPPSPTTPPAPIVWPLTGVQTGEVAARPAIAVKIENSHVARPQKGLEQADMVWETIIDFDVSRLVAVFQSQVPEDIGPIRSVRPMDMAIVKPLGGPLVFSGGQEGILDMVKDAGIQGMNNDYAAPGMYRSKERKAPHNVYGKVQTFIDNADGEHNKPPQAQFGFALTPDKASAVAAGTPAASVSFHLSSQSDPAWGWDPASNAWLRSEGSTPATVASGARISAVNVVAIVANHPNSGFGAQNGAPVPTYDLVGDGTGLVATGGKVIEVTWHKGALEQPIQLTAKDGTPVTLAPGNTWVELVPAGSGSWALG